MYLIFIKWLSGHHKNHILYLLPVHYHSSIFGWTASIQSIFHFTKPFFSITKSSKMQLSALFFPLFLSTAVMAKSNHTDADSTKSLCKEMDKLTKIVDIAANTTKLDAIAKDNATKIAEFQAKASDASTKLTTLSTNTTLVAACAVISAAETTERDCDEMDKLQKTVEIAANTTLLDDKTQGNATKIAEFQAKASAATTKLATLTSNSTLVSTCSSIKAAKESDAGTFISIFEHLWRRV